MSKNVKQFLIKYCISIIIYPWAFKKDVLDTEEDFCPQRRISSTSKQKISKFFSIFVAQFMLILIQNTGENRALK
jgi:hypothetical protein